MVFVCASRNQTTLMQPSRNETRLELFIEQYTKTKRQNAITICQRCLNRRLYLYINTSTCLFFDIVFDTNYAESEMICDNHKLGVKLDIISVTFHQQQQQMRFAAPSQSIVCVWLIA